jgi:hypothetical protein
MGERKLAPVRAMKAVAAACQETVNTMIERADQAMQVRTPGGVFSVRWDQRGSATALGQMAFFAEYLEATGLFEGWLKSCPLSYTSPNAPELVDVLGTWMLSILDGHCRYAHVGALRGDGVAPSILGMNKIIGDDSLRRALGAIAPAPDAKHTELQRLAQQAQLARSVQGMQEQLKHSIAQATLEPWILDCDTTIKPLYGKQDGAVVSYNPHKPGRPSHAIHTYWHHDDASALSPAREQQGVFASLPALTHRAPIATLPLALHEPLDTCGLTQLEQVGLADGLQRAHLAFTAIGTVASNQLRALLLGHALQQRH